MQPYNHVLVKTTNHFYNAKLSIFACVFQTFSTALQQPIYYIYILALYKGVNYSDTGITKYVNLLVHFIKVYLYLVSIVPHLI